MSGPETTRSSTVWRNSACIQNVPDASVYHPAMAEFGSVPRLHNDLPDESDYIPDSPPWGAMGEHHSDSETDLIEQVFGVAADAGAVGADQGPDDEQSLAVGSVDRDHLPTEAQTWDVDEFSPGCKFLLGRYNQALY